MVAEHGDVLARKPVECRPPAEVEGDQAGAGCSSASRRSRPSRSRAGDRRRCRARWCARPSSDRPVARVHQPQQVMDRPGGRASVAKGRGMWSPVIAIWPPAVHSASRNHASSLPFATEAPSGVVGHSAGRQVDLGDSVPRCHRRPRGPPSSTASAGRRDPCGFPRLDPVEPDTPKSAIAVGQEQDGRVDATGLGQERHAVRDPFAVDPEPVEGVSRHKPSARHGQDADLGPTRLDQAIVARHVSVPMSPDLRTPTERQRTTSIS